MKRSVCALTMFLTAAVARGGTVNPPIGAEVFVKGEAHATSLRGALTQFDDQGFTLRTGTEDKQLAWTDVTAASAFSLRQRTIDRSKAGDWLTLGKFGWSIGATTQAQNALRMAVKLDASLKPNADKILASDSGSAVSTSTNSGGKELLTTGPAPAPTTKPAKAKTADADAPVVFAAPTPEQISAAMQKVHEQRDGIEKTLGLKLAEFETDHFIVFTDWDTREYDFLKVNLEGAYSVVAKQFQMSPKDTVFVGKLPVYMMARYSDFARFAREIDNFPDVNDRTAGYYMGNTGGFGHMAMWKPDNSLTGTNNIDDARRLWAYVLTHEFTHAFLARYKSNVFVPRWLNEGIAEVIAMNQFPYPDHYRMARYMASMNNDLSFLFDDANRPTGEYYPVMQSMVELLVQTNRQSFLKLIDEIKQGKPAEQAMQEIYHADYAGFAKAWRDWAKNQYAGY